MLIARHSYRFVIDIGKVASTLSKKGCAVVLIVSAVKILHTIDTHSAATSGFTSSDAVSIVATLYCQYVTHTVADDYVTAIGKCAAANGCAVCSAISLQRACTLNGERRTRAACHKGRIVAATHA